MIHVQFLFAKLLNYLLFFHNRKLFEFVWGFLCLVVWIGGFFFRKIKTNIPLGLQSPTTTQQKNYRGKTLRKEKSSTIPGTVFTLTDAILY